MKKLLALVLAMVMTLGLATVGTSAAAPKYADSDSINYKQAVDVMSTIGVLGGDENGFRPGDELKRSEGAKIIAYLMLGSTAAEQITGGTKYTDVPASHWAAGYIEYLTVEGVVGGIGDHKFDPDGTLTTAAFTKMLIGALGYDAEIEGLGGPDWAINVQRLAKQIGLFDGNKNAVASANIKREEAAQYAFNMIKSPLVEYENKGSTMSVNGATISFGAGKAKYRVNTGKSWARYDQIDTKLTNDNNASQIVEFAEEYYEKLVLKGNGDTDAFDRPADIWTFNGKKIGEYKKDEDLLYTTTVTLGTIYKDLGLTKATYPTETKDADGVSLFFRDGKAQNAANVKIEKESSVKIGGNGTETYVYYDEGKVRICEVNWYVGDVTGVFAATASKDAYIDIAGRGEGIYCQSGSKSNVDFKVDDIVIYTASLDNNKVDIQTVAKAETTKGKLESFVMRAFEGGVSAASTGSVTLGGKKYPYSAMVANTPDGSFIKSGVELDLVLDKYGNAIDVGDYGVQNYAVVTNVSSRGGSFQDSKIVNLLLTDGTTTGAVSLTDKHSVSNANLGSVSGRTAAGTDELQGSNIYYANNTADKTGEDKAYYDYNTPGWKNDKAGGITVGDIVTYTIDSEGKYTLLLKKHANPYTNNTASDVEIIENGKSSLSLSDAFNYGPTATYTTAKDKRGNGKTVYLIKDDGNFKAYEGSTQIPTIKLEKNKGPVYANSYAAETGRMGDTSGAAAAQIVYVDTNKQAKIFTNEAVFIRVDGKYNKSVNSNGDVYFAVEAIVNGKHYEGDDLFKVDVTSYTDAETEAKASGKGIVLFTSMTTNSRGIANLTGMEKYNAAGFIGMPRYGSKPVSKGMIGLGTYTDGKAKEDITFESYTKDVSVWYLNDQDEIVKSNISNIPNSETTGKSVYTWFTKDSSENVNYILWTDTLGKGKGGNANTIDAAKKPSYETLKAALTAGGEVAIVNTGTMGYTLPVSDTGEVLSIPSNAKLSVYKNDGVDLGDLYIPTNGSSATMLVKGEVECATAYVDGRLYIEEDAKFTCDSMKISDTGHVKNSGTLTIKDGKKDSKIEGKSLEIIGGEVSFAGPVTVVGSFSMSGGNLFFKSPVTVEKTSTFTLGGGVIVITKLVLADEAKVDVTGSAATTIQYIEFAGTKAKVLISSNNVVFYAAKASNSAQVVAASTAKGAKAQVGDTAVKTEDGKDTTGKLDDDFVSVTVGLNVPEGNAAKGTKYWLGEAFTKGTTGALKQKAANAWATDLFASENNNSVIVVPSTVKVSFTAEFKAGDDTSDAYADGYAAAGDTVAIKVKISGGKTTVTEDDIMIDAGDFKVVTGEELTQATDSEGKAIANTFIATYEYSFK